MSFKGEGKVRKNDSKFYGCVTSWVFDSTPRKRTMEKMQFAGEGLEK